MTSIRFELFVTNLEKSVDFYTRLLGFNIVKKSANYASLQREEVIIGIGSQTALSNDHYFQPEIEIARKGLGVETVLEVEDIEAEHKKFADANYPLECELTLQRWGLTDFRLVDPNGYYIRITTH